MAAPEKRLADAAGAGKGTTMGALVDMVHAAGAGADDDVLVVTPRPTNFAGATGMGATLKGIVDARGTGADGSGAASGDGGGGVSGDSVDRYGWGSSHNLTRVSSSRALLALTLRYTSTNMAVMRHDLSSCVRGMSVLLEDMVVYR
jgi:hypothetical protein